ncbi:hypothetical protein Poly30_04610 [Planctomycetes bacterium Poly30]|uniref:Uncharacterized protein n=1 Tax=Saltatorellus ferox TaxID=2528018 RepID=A0A518ELJ0_9BACT|nr:hypothetical protein Poly30_04610 [Planctomycetes bacterium Poly30]
MAVAIRVGTSRGLILLALLVILLVTVLAPGAQAQARIGDVPASDVEAKRARWERLSDAEKAELRERFQRLQKLPEGERSKLRERAQRLAGEMAEIEASLGEEERAELDALAPGDRAKELRRLVAERARNAASRLRSRMTPEERQSLESASPDERARILRSIRERDLSRLPEHVASLGEELGLSVQELGRIRDGSPEEQRAAIARLLRRRVEKQVKEQGLPDGLGEARWERLQKTEDEAFFRALQSIRRRHPGFGIPRKRWEAHLRRSESLAERLETMVAPDAADRARFPKLPERLLARRVVSLRRGRIEDLVIRQAKLGPESSERLRGLPDRDFLILHAVMVRVLREGGDLATALGRWFDRAERSGPGGETKR